MVEFYSGGNPQPKLNPRELAKIKKNMQKVPLIQAKSDEYHQQELLKAEIEFEQAQKNIKKGEESRIIQEVPVTANTPKSKFQKRLTHIKNVFNRSKK